MKRRSSGGRVGIRANLLLGFGIFTFVFVALLWVFQVFFLNSFYKAMKIAEVKSSASAVVKSLDSDSLYQTVDEIVAQRQLNVLVCDDTGTVVYYDVTGKINPFARLSREEYRMLYDDTLQKGGTDFMRYTADGRESDTSFFALMKNQNSAESYLFALALTTPGGAKRLVLVMSNNIAPLVSTVQTMNLQLVCVCVLMLVLAMVLSVLISNRISRPIVRMNRSAAQLAMGNYAVQFEEKGSKETVELAQSLNYAARELSKVENLRRELMANVSHDLRTPLTMITGYSEVMRDLPGENTPENVQIIIDEAKRLTALVNDMLDISKIQAGSVQLQLQDFNLTDVIRGILMRYDKLSGYQFTLECEKDVWVHADELKITQVIYNLVNNAINYSGEKKNIRIRQSVQAQKVKIEVMDNGEGIEPDKLKDIWERYYKVDKEHKRSQVGTGLGLSIVKGILDMHGGVYGVSSTVGVGSDFWFELDMAQEPAARLPGAADIIDH